MNGSENSKEEERRVIMMTPEAFVRMIEVLKKAFGSAGDSMIYIMGRERGSFETRKELEKIALSRDEHSRRQLLERVLQWTSNRGWGEMTVTKFDMLNGIVAYAIKQNPFVTLCRLPDSAYCFFLRGYLAGITTEITEQKMSFDELKCVLLEGEHCVIRLKKTHRSHELRLMNG